MGINGLLPALKPIAKAVHISKYRGQRAAVDGYSWLHKGAYCCARELCEGTWTDKYAAYFMSRIQLLRMHGVEPVVVFDGGRLPIKGEEEQTRHRARAEAREKAAAHLAAGNVAAAIECYQRCVDITPAMAKRVIEELKAQGVQFIVAPYEADAQMAHLARRGDVQLVITEDSDLLAYGCPRVLYKLDRTGAGEEFFLTDLPNCPGLPLSGFTSDQFLQLCVMAGCDFLAQLPGIGLKKAHGVLRKYRSFTKVVKMLRFSGTRVPPDYEVRFQMALWAFRHCRVYCPATKALVHLAPLPPGGLGAADVDVPEALTHLAAQEQQQRLDFLGPDLPEQVARGIAEGQLDPMSHKPYDLAAIFAGCSNPPPHIAAQLPALTAVPHTLGLRSGSSGAAAAAGDAAAAVSGGKAGSGASKPRFGMSRRHTGQQKLSWGPAAAAAGASNGKGAGTAAARPGGSGGAAGRSGGQKVALGIAKYFLAAPAAGTPRPAAAAGPQPSEAAVGAATATPAAAHSMQHNILQALQALQQQQQHRQQQQCVQQEEEITDQPEQQGMGPLGWSEARAAAAAAAASAGAAAGLPPSKRARLSDRLGNGSSGSGSLFADAAAEAAALAGDGMSDHAGMLLGQQHNARTIHVQQAQQQQQQQQGWQQPGSLSIGSVIQDSQEDPESGPSAADDHGRPAAGHCHMFAAEAEAGRDDAPWAEAAGSGDGSGDGSIGLPPGCSLPSGSSSMPGSSCMQQGGTLSDSMLGVPGSGMGGRLMSLNGTSQDLSGLQNPSGLLPGQQQQQEQDDDPFGVTGAAVAARGAAVSTLAALIHSISSEQQQQQLQSPAALEAAAPGLQRRTRGSSNSRFFQGGSSSCSPAVLSGTAGDATFLGGGEGSDPMLMPSSLPGSSSLSDGMLGSGSGPGNGPGSSLSGCGLGSEDDALPGFGSRLGQQQQQQALGSLGIDVAEHVQQEVISPPRPHQLALGGSSGQAWQRLRQSLRLRASGLSRCVPQAPALQHNGPDLLQQEQQVGGEVDGLQQQQQHRRHQQLGIGAPGQAGSEQEQAAGPGSGTSGGSSSNDENAEPADAGDIHSIAHIKQYAKLATEVVDKVQQQQQCQQQLSPLRLAGSAANTAAAAQHRLSGLLSSQSYLRSSSNSRRKSSGGNSQHKGDRGQQRTSLAHWDTMRYDPSLLFVPVPKVVSGADRQAAAAAVLGAVAGGAEHEAGSDVEVVGEEPGEPGLAPAAGSGQQRPAAGAPGGRLGGGSSRGGIAARPFKAPRSSSQGQADCKGGGFGAFSKFACGSVGEGPGRPAGSKAGSRWGLGGSWLR